MTTKSEIIGENTAGKLSREDSTIVLTLATADVRKLVEFMNLLPASHELANAQTVELDLSRVPSFYPSFAAMFSAWFIAHSRDMSHTTFRVIAPQSQGAHSWLTKVGFFDLLKHGATSPRTDDVTVAIHPIAPGNSASAEAAIEHLSNLVRRNAEGFAGDVLNSAQTAIAEVVENVSRHAHATTSSFVCGQYHPTTHKLSICVADSGIGLRRSFEEAPYQPARERLEAGDDPLDLAIEPLMSSRYGMGHSGYGLFYASELCRQARGRFAISSGSGSLVLLGNEQFKLHHRWWDGTVVNLMLDSNSNVNSSAIWAKLPSEENDGDWVTSYLPAAAAPFISMQLHGTRLYTRDTAKAIFDQIKESVSQGLPISMKHVTTITPSFADELFGNLYQALGEQRYRAVVKISDASDYMQRLIELVLKNRRTAKRADAG